MSFSDFKGSKNAPKRPTTSASAAMANTTGKDGMEIISESLLQYQVRFVML
jgi:hypothetical protein